MTGIYAVTAQIEWEPNATGTRLLALRKNGTTPIAGVNASPPAVPFEQEVTTQVRLQAGDFVEAIVEQDSGGGLDVTQDPEFTPELAMSWLAPGP